MKLKTISDNLGKISAKKKINPESTRLESFRTIQFDSTFPGRFVVVHAGHFDVAW